MVGPMKRYYSIQATADRDIPFPRYLVILGKGVNAFTLTTENIEETIKEFLVEGVKIQKVHCLSGTGSFDGMPLGVLLPGESPPEQETNLCALGEVVPESR